MLMALIRRKTRAHALRVVPIQHDACVKQTATETTRGTWPLMCVRVGVTLLPS